MIVFIEVLAELGALEEQIKLTRPEKVSVGETEVRLDYRVDAETGEEYAALDLALPIGWLAEIEGDTCGELTGIRLYLHETSRSGA